MYVLQYVDTTAMYMRIDSDTTFFAVLPDEEPSLCHACLLLLSPICQLTVLCATPSMCFL